jgi:hypothetical protein
MFAYNYAPSVVFSFSYTHTLHLFLKIISIPLGIYFSLYFLRLALVMDSVRIKSIMHSAV